jgi:hypothetical protein
MDTNSTKEDLVFLCAKQGAVFTKTGQKTHAKVLGVGIWCIRFFLSGCVLINAELLQHLVFTYIKKEKKLNR